jgi:hypothetical protein
MLAGTTFAHSSGVPRVGLGPPALQLGPPQRRGGLVRTIGEAKFNSQRRDHSMSIRYLGNKKWEDGHRYLMLRMNQKDRIPMAISSKLVSRPWPTLQRAREYLMLIRAWTRKKTTRYRSSSVCRYLACGRGNKVLLYQAYPDIRKMIMKMRSIQAQSLLILTSSRPVFNWDSPQEVLFCED